MTLTPLMLIAGRGLQEDTALEINSEMNAELNTYTSTPFLSTFNNIVATMEADAPYEVPDTSPEAGPGDTIIMNPNGLAQYANDIKHMFDNTMPSLSNVLPTSSGINTTFFSNFINHHANNILGNGSNSVYIGHLLSVYGFTQTANEYINTATNGETFASQTFTDMDALITGNISSVNKYTTSFGQDLINTGNLYDFSNLSYFGSPGSLMAKLNDTNLITTIATELEEQGIDVTRMQEQLIDNAGEKMKLAVQKKCYDAFVNVTGQDLESILTVLGINTTGINTLADVLDIKVMFPNSYTTMQSLNNGVLENIYTGGTISAYVAAFKTDLVHVMPDDIAKANYAMSLSLQQIKNIHDSDPKTIGEQAQSLETNQGLDELNSLTRPVPTDITEYYQNTMGKGSGINGTYYISDGVGTASGIPHTANFATINAAITQFEADNALQPFLDIFAVIENVIDSNSSYYDYVDPLEDPEDPPNLEDLQIPAGSPGAGIYANKALAMQQLIIEANTAAANLVVGYPTETSSANNAYQSSIDHVLLELQTLQDAEIRFPVTYTTFDAPSNWVGMQPSKDRALNFASNLHTYSKETSKGHLVEILEGVANDTRGGQAIVAAMREGRNLAKIENAGLAADNRIPNDPEEVLPGNIAPSTY